MISKKQEVALLKIFALNLEIYSLRGSKFTKRNKKFNILFHNFDLRLTYYNQK